MSSPYDQCQSCPCPTKLEDLSGADNTTGQWWDVSQDLQQLGASSHLMRTSELADLTLTFSSVLCFRYLTRGILFILPLNEIFHVSSESLVHICLSKPHCVYQELFFHLGYPCSCYTAGWKDKSSNQRRQITSLFVYFQYHLLEAEGIAGRVAVPAACSAGCLWMLPVSAARGQAGCPVAVRGCEMDGMACGLRAPVPGSWLGARSQARPPPIDPAGCALRPAGRAALLRAARAALPGQHEWNSANYYGVTSLEPYCWGSSPAH